MCTPLLHNSGENTVPHHAPTFMCHVMWYSTDRTAEHFCTMVQPAAKLYLTLFNDHNYYGFIQMHACGTYT